MIRILFIFFLISFSLWSGEIRVLTWNIQNIGSCKMLGENCSSSSSEERSTLIQAEIARILKGYDLIFIQELSTSNSVSKDDINAFVNSLQAGYKWKVSKDVGNTSGNTERYLVLFNPTKLTFEQESYIEKGCIIRSPYIIKFKEVPIYFATTHITAKKKAIIPEMSCIETGLRDTYPKWVVLGDMNADCQYYPKSRGPITKAVFRDAKWYVHTGTDTTVAKTDCAYDRIISDKNTIGRGVKVIRPISANPDLPEKRVSDHYPVEIIFEY
ncbi:MAG TPA: endonuclease/exonuclease/phosphatase family protein [Leptospiraceae bacterium]|nr:endonuclease/exonuclease/phosphatase family protein [Leptospiraceae bacterium]HMW03894.1 endonuclease/exonuclease/phosphatase family protein [Leptospiraceae bacterium]HMX32392.1 endonuclease/exonuclease/phosphatase family protein [Leptospiraceae bacterium]HMY29874.1 endonuclease/exonuclease/phosphatase family protein [Leptospiraceae bacterium]HMZ62982.1 endonuclease/exonuclease/phosphatase family protein [Leptospiraceae bacterium]